MNWTDKQLPTLHTAYNTLALARQTRLTMTIWAGGHEVLLPVDTIVAHVNIPLDTLTAVSNAEGYSEMFLQAPIVAENLEIGQASIKITYSEK